MRYLPAEVCGAAAAQLRTAQLQLKQHSQAPTPQAPSSASSSFAAAARSPAPLPDGSGAGGSSPAFRPPDWPPAPRPAAEWEAELLAAPLVPLHGRANGFAPGRPTCLVSGRPIRGPRVLLEDGVTSLAPDTAATMARLVAYSPLGSGAFLRLQDA